LRDLSLTAMLTTGTVLFILHRRTKRRCHTGTGMNQNQSVLPPEFNAEWDFEGTEFPLPNGAGTGCMQVVELTLGGKFYCSEFRVKANCIIDASADAGKASQLLCSQALLSGQLTLETPDGNQYANTPNRSLLMRVCKSGGRLHLPGNQVIRHIGVTLPLDNEGLSCPEMDPILSPFAQETDNCLVRPVYWQKRTRTLATELFQLASRADQPLHILKRDGLARCFLASLLEDYASQQQTSQLAKNNISVWEQQIADQVCDYMRLNLSTPLRGDGLAAHFGLSRHRLNEIFRILKGQSVSEYIREQRLTTARIQIEIEGLPVKVVAHNVGYRHVSNFTSAYRQHFGVTPGRSQSTAVQS